MHSPEPYDTAESIAVIGMSGRFPGARNITEFWTNLRNGVESISFFTAEELMASGVDHRIRTNKNFVNAFGVLDGVEMFDAAFFGFNAREAEVLDPQHRFFMECAWEALEDAGYDPATYDGAIGLYAGTSMSTYLFNLISNQEFMALVGGFQVLLGNDKDHLTTRISYKLNLKGPSLTVQTACSTSLVAVCTACQSVLDHQCDMALAGGVGIKIPQKTGYLYQEGMIYSPDGHCRTFDSDAQGTVGGNGVGVVLLKRLPDAVADGDHIRAIIRGWAVNNDGSLKVGYTAPSVEGQAEVIATAHALAGVPPDTITYIEAHGTATPLGDPIEVAALTQAFRAGTDKQNFCALGSVKSNVGHLDAAAGIAGFIKAVLAVEHAQIPPSLHFKKPNSRIRFEGSPFYVNASLSEWKSEVSPRRAGVSSFGMGGTNAHVVLEQAATRKSSSPSRTHQLLLLSASTGAALERATTNLAGYLRENSSLNFADVAYTSQVGRRAFGHRRMVVCQSVADAVHSLETRDTRRVASSAPTTGKRYTVFMFPGQGTQYVNMGLGLYRSEPVFRDQIDRCADVLQSRLGFDIRRILYPTSDETEEAKKLLDQTAITQPVLFGVEYALAELWKTWGIEPAAMIGHSIGEYVAACVSGVLSLEDALMLVAQRAQLMQKMPAGSMLSVPLSERDVQPFIDEQLSVAVLNEPDSCVVSGPVDCICRLETTLTQGGLLSQRLHTSHAFHSAMMEPVVRPFAEFAKNVRMNAPRIPYMSNVTGTWITPQQAMNPNYWGLHLRRPVRFAEGLRPLVKRRDCLLLEVGPGRSLSSFARQQMEKNTEVTVLTSLRHPSERVDDISLLLTALGQFWLSGVTVSWAGFYAHELRHRVPLPTYPFERQRYWVDAPRVQQEREGHSSPRPIAQPKSGGDFLFPRKPDPRDWFYRPSWQSTDSPELPAGGPSKNSNWLVFGDGGSLSSKITKRLAELGHNVTVVRAGKEFSKTAEGAYAIRPGQREVGSSRVDLQACKLEYSIVSPK